MSDSQIRRGASGFQQEPFYTESRPPCPTCKGSGVAGLGGHLPARAQDVKVCPQCSGRNVHDPRVRV